MPASVPNVNNNPQLNAAQATEANESIKNFIKGINFPPTTAGDRDKMKAAIAAFKAQVQKTKAAAAKNAKGGTAAPAAAQLAAQATKVGSQVPDLAKYLPAGTNLANVSFADAIKAMENTVSQMDGLIKNPTGQGGSVNSTVAANNVKAV